MQKSAIPIFLIAGILSLSVAGYAYYISSSANSTSSFARRQTPTPAPISLEFPEIPVFPGAKIISTNKKNEQGKLGSSFRYESHEPTFIIMKWYRENLAALGWSEIEPPEFPDSERSIFTRFQNGNLHLDIEVEREEKPFTEIFVSFPLQAL